MPTMRADPNVFAEDRTWMGRLVLMRVVLELLFRYN